MTAQLNPYLSFKGQAREAMDFYKSVFGGELTRSTFGEFHASEDPADHDLIMHSQLTGRTGLVFMASDTSSRMPYSKGENFSMSLSGASDDEAELTGYYNALVDGGTVLEPLVQAPWGDRFGMVKDKYDITWLVNIAAPSGSGQ
ncbi:VOC family protein [soil metagenome]